MSAIRLDSLGCFKYVRLTQVELDAIDTYQTSVPTSPSPGRRYKRERWIGPDGKSWHAPHEHAVRWAIARAEHLEALTWYKGKLTSQWVVYDVVLSSEPGYVDHVPRIAKVVS